MITALILSAAIAATPTLPPLKKADQFTNWREPATQCMDAFTAKSISRTREACQIAFAWSVADKDADKEVRHIVSDALHFVISTDERTLISIGWTK